MSQPARRGGPRADDAPSPRIGVVVLSQGTRPVDLEHAFATLFAQEGVDLDVVCVGNGWEVGSDAGFGPVAIPEQVARLSLPENVGIPAGRNAGVPSVSDDLLFFLDDDASLPDADFLARAAARFAASPSLGALQARVDDPLGGDPPRRWIPRTRKREATTSSEVFSVWEGALMVRRSAFAAASGWPSAFWYAHEGVDLALGIWGAGFRVEYAGDLRVFHPVIDPARHSDYYFRNAHNRALVARRNLPFPLSLMHVTTWAAVQVARWWRSPAQLRTWFGGARAGWRAPLWSTGEAPRPRSWRFVARMVRHGRFPLL